MEPLQILDRYFNSFITQDNSKHFFIGLTDYLDYGDGIPEFDLITSRISAMPQTQLQQFEKKNVAALEKMRAFHDEIALYVESNKIDTSAINNALRECTQILQGHVHSSMPMPYMLHLRLYDVIQELYATSEHKAFATKHIVFSERNGTPRIYLPVKELDELMVTKKEIEHGHEDAIWGAQASLYELREIVHKGREISKRINDRVKNRESGAVFEWMNFGVVMDEWQKIEDGRPDRDPVFFNPTKMRPKAQRFHMYVIAHFAEAKGAVSKVTPKEMMELRFDVNASRLHVQGQEFRIRRVSDQYDVLRVLFADRNETAKEWFFAEISEKIDSTRSQERLKKYYNAAYQISLKLGAKGVPDFFLTTSHSVRVNPIYLS